jgi:hypothetical protein
MHLTTKIFRYVLKEKISFYICDAYYLIAYFMFLDKSNFRSVQLKLFNDIGLIRRRSFLAKRSPTEKSNKNATERRD